MRRVLVVSAATTLLLGTAVVAAPSSSAGGVGRLVMSGNVADFEWTTCPDPQPGDVCRRTVVLATDQVVHETNDDRDPALRGELIRWGGPAVFLRIWDYSFDRYGEYVDIRESFGAIGVPGIPGSPVVRIDTRLRSVTIEATDVRMDVHEADGTERREYRSVALVGRGTGPLQRINEGTMAWTLERRDVVRARGWARAATATARVDGVPVAGTFMGGRLQHGTYTEVLVLKGQVASAVAMRTAGPSDPTSARMTRYVLARGDASWSSCETAQVGETCREVFVAYDDLTDAGGARSATATLLVWDFRLLEVSEAGRFYEDVGSLVVYGAPAEVTWSARLDGAAVSVPQAEAAACRYDGTDAEPVCTNRVVGFSAAFTGTGAAQRFASHVISWGAGERSLRHLTGRARTASAVAQVDGVPVGQPLTSATISVARGFAR